MNGSESTLSLTSHLPLQRDVSLEDGVNIATMICRGRAWYSLTTRCDITHRAPCAQCFVAGTDAVVFQRF